MSLPLLIKFIYNNGTDESIRRGKKIHNLGYVELVDYDALLNDVTFRVKDDIYATFNKVSISHFNQEKTISLRCTCPYNLGEVCRHKAASLFRLQELIDKNLLGEKELVYDQQHTVVKMKKLDVRTIKMLASPQVVDMADQYLEQKQAKIIEAKNEKVIAEINMGDTSFKVCVQKNEERNFDTSCTCHSSTSHPLCLHKTILFLQLSREFGSDYFDTIRNLDNEKNKLLSLYGYSLQDDLKGKFEFSYVSGKPFLRILDTSIKRVSAISALTETAPSVATETEILNEPFTTKKLALVIQQDPAQYPFLQIHALYGEMDEDDTFIQKPDQLDFSKFIQTNHFSDHEKKAISILRKCLPSEVSRFLTRNSPFSGIWENIIQQHDEALAPETRQLILEYLHPKYIQLFHELSAFIPVYYQNDENQDASNHLTLLTISKSFIRPVISVMKRGDVYDIQCKAKVEKGLINISENELKTPALIKLQDVIYIWQQANDIIEVEKFSPTGKRIIDSSNWEEYLKNHLLPLSKKYDIELINIQSEVWKEVLPGISLELRERGDYLLIHIIFSYKDYIIQEGDQDKIVYPYQNKLVIIHRNIPVENAFIQKLEALHTHFKKTDEAHTLALKGAEVLKNNWFFLFADAIKELNIPVTGFEALKKFRFNSARPSTKIQITHNMDWFDAKVDIQFNGNKVKIADIKKALGKQEQYVQLEDGSLGILPEEWLQKYSLLFRVGESKNDALKLSRYHYSVIEDLYHQRDEEELSILLDEKYESIKNNFAVSEIPAPEHLQQILRPYQEAGFHWLHYLNQVKWGGILADDMGLGKTIQALAFLHHYKTIHGAIKALVVCPTTLMFNWENEINKFTPSLSHHVHHGGTRDQALLHNLETDIFITTYGTLRSDIKYFKEILFDYIILDESQAIKNPASKIAKAASILKSKNKLCLSGTPLQNNTFDLYAQMNFLNPGMLGSIEFFKQEFSIPIDKLGVQENKEHLRKLLYPFILRRTKEQVAQDLPEKHEMTVYCEMGKIQRSIYDAYRNEIRSKLLGEVESMGLGKSQLSILQGLMKLRQICDSPAILKDGKPFPNESAKLDELTREITENIGEHKALIFSQFLGMLSLIKEKLIELDINFEYFDGSTSAPERERAINHFQDDKDCRVFLISLKAGGVGLNLTSADYVYIVDPWWNPAVEQQAIDRTHRIGQTKNIFAYRMICTDTVEDKILLLQEKKKALAADLVADDHNFVKTLSKEDIEYLFS
ncbi:MAG: DEAD/DEAH box helicase [Bacteroidetes bacterium]|nr:DEAD/DEAH box helicase [Bacteroidota bacterium]